MSRKPTLEVTEQRAKDVGLTFIGPYTKNSVKTKYLCPTHGTIEMRPSNVQSGCGCYQCFPEKLKGPRKDIQRIVDKVVEQGLEFIGPYVTFDEPFLVRCPVHGEFRLFASNVMKSGRTLFRGCKSCFVASRQKSIEDTKQDAIDVGLEYVSGYTSLSKKCVYRCPVHGIIEMLPSNVYSGHGCRKCSRNGKNLDKQKFFYIFDVFDSESVYTMTGYGVTYNFKSRKSSYMSVLKKNNMTLSMVGLYEFEDGKEAYQFEKFIKTLYKPVETELTGLITESVSLEDRDNLIGLLEELGICVHSS